MVELPVMADSHFDSLTRRNALKTLGGAGAVAVAGPTERFQRVPPCQTMEMAVCHHR